MSTYLELLNMQYWRDFRNEILHEQNWTCQNCKNDWINGKEAEMLISVKEYNNAKTEGLFGFIINFTVGDIFIDSAFFWTKNKFFFDELKLDKDTEVIYENAEGNNGRFYNKIIAFRKSKKWVYVNNIHIHHKYYQEGLLPWEYPKNAVETLCWKCHEGLHKNNFIPHLNINGVEIGKFKTCWKCYGAGYLPEYYYHQAGTCFACMGKKYLQL